MNEKLGCRANRFMVKLRVVFFLSFYVNLLLIFIIFYRICRVNVSVLQEMGYPDMNLSLAGSLANNEKYMFRTVYCLLRKYTSYIQFVNDESNKVSCYFMLYLCFHI